MENAPMDYAADHDSALSKFKHDAYLEAAQAMLRHLDTLSEEGLLGARAVLLLHGCLS
jgi:hypothetical protein